MIAIYERRVISQPEKIWAAKYLDLHNLSHWHNECEIVCCEKKSCETQCNGETIQLSEGEAAFIPSGTIHNIRSEKEGILITILIDNSLLKGITDRFRLKNVKISFPPIFPLYEKIKRELTTKQPFYEIILQDSVRSFVAEVFRYNELLPTPPREQNRKSAMIRQILDEIETNYQFITFEEIRRKFGYSPAHFSRLFSLLAGINFTDYLNAVKIEHAIREIQNLPQKSITQISIDNGFSSIRNFNRIFKKMTGYSPKKLPLNFSVNLLKAGLYNHIADPTQHPSILLESF